MWRGSQSGVIAMRILGKCRLAMAGFDSASPARAYTNLLYVLLPSDPSPSAYTRVCAARPRPTVSLYLELLNPWIPVNTLKRTQNML